MERAACVVVFNVLLTGSAHAAGGDREFPSLPIWDAGAVDRALVGAAERLRDSECQGLLDDFADTSGRPLRARLDETGLDASDYLRTMAFRDGASHPHCRSDLVLMVAQPGRSTVLLCRSAGRAMSRLAVTLTQNPQLGEFAMIHEMLHTLGLGENPPTSQQITNTVRRRCWRVTRRAAR